jgi:hypothetical protein
MDKVEIRTKHHIVFNILMLRSRGVVGVKGRRSGIQVTLVLALVSLLR